MGVEAKGHDEGSEGNDICNSDNCITDMHPVECPEPHAGKELDEGNRDYVLDRAGPVHLQDLGQKAKRREEGSKSTNQQPRIHSNHLFSRVMVKGGGERLVSFLSM